MTNLIKDSGRCLAYTANRGPFSTFKLKCIEFTTYKENYNKFIILYLHMCISSISHFAVDPVIC